MNGWMMRKAFALALLVGVSGCVGAADGTETETLEESVLRDSRDGTIESGIDRRHGALEELFAEDSHPASQRQEAAPSPGQDRAGPVPDPWSPGAGNREP